MSTFGISATETNCLFGAGGVQRSVIEQQAIETFISSLEVEFPETEVMSSAARNISDAVYNHVEYLITNPDKKIIEWTNMEYALFRALEEYRYGDIVRCGFRQLKNLLVLQILY